ncbi:Ig-like domain-containing protein [Thiomicrorhabdus chilensis]|uniref:Ig-like domain-containing protein n=1 Tax=Thiomicrorhabdus chilensis TaxID=63656 RepID=UPI0004222D4E|nr:Ig-like domain-containing protein [Thiomicrorhabdus chilensis]
MVKFLKWFGLLVSILTLAGCGGSGGGADTASFDSLSPGVNLQMKSASTGDVTTSFSENDVANVFVKIVDSNGALVKNESITIAATGGAIVSQSTAETDLLGGASFVLLPPEVDEGAVEGTVSVSYASGSGSIAYTFYPSSQSGDVSVTGEPSLQIQMQIASTLEETTNIPTSEDAKITVTLVDGEGTPLPNEILNVRTTVGDFDGIYADEIRTGDGTNALIGTRSVTLTAPDDLLSGVAPGVFTVRSETYGIEEQLTFEFFATTSAQNDDTSSVASIIFDSVDPSIISLKGTGSAGYGETSVVKFIVLDNSGNPIADVPVNFELTTIIGGLSLSTSTANTNASGEASTIVQAGTIPTPVRVTASVTLPNGESIFVQSSQLTVTTGIPDQNSFSLSMDKFAPEGLNHDGEVVNVTVLLGDRFNNSVKDGTVINFTTEGGVIDPSCATVNSTCSVVWRSSNPRPEDHRSTVLAYAIGHETYFDDNGSGVFDDGDSFDDMPEAFRDDDENGVFNPDATNGFLNDFSQDEKPYDYNNNGIYDTADGIYNGMPCENTTGLCPVTDASKLIHVRQSAQIIMASSSPDISVYETTSGSCLTATGKIKTDGSCTTGDVVFANGLETRVFWILIEDTAALCVDGAGERVDATDPDDANCTIAIRQSAPTGSTVSVASEVGELSTVPVTEILNTTGYTAFFVSLTSSPDNADVETGLFEVTVTTPKGLKVPVSFNVTDPIN